MTELDDLAYRLERGFARRPGENADWREPVAMVAALSRVRQSVGDRLAERAGPRINRSLLAFRMAPDAVGFVDLKLACRGATRAADWEGRRLIDDERLFERLLKRVSVLVENPVRWQRCFGALLAAWLETAVQSQADEVKNGPEENLREWLESGIAQLKAARGWPQILIGVGRLPVGQDECRSLLSQLG